MLTDEQQIKIFGETIADMTEAKPASIDNIMYAMMIMSDVQEILTIMSECESVDASERGRQFLNKAKFFLSLESGE